MDDRSSPDPSEVEASEEFPILYGLLTAADTDNSLKRKQGTNSNYTSSTSRYFQGSRRRRVRLPSSETGMEPDSSTTDDLEPIITPSLPAPSTLTNNSSPLLVLRLTATASSKQFSNPPKRQQYQILQSGTVRGVRKTSRSKKQTENEEPSSTTSEDGEIPFKIRRISTESGEGSNNNVSNTNGGTLRALLSKDRGSCNGQGHINCYNTSSPLSLIGEREPESESFDDSNQPSCRRLQRIGIDFFPCNNCDLNFSKLQHLELHQSYHTNKKLYKCSKCSSTFYLKKSLQNHESKHHGVKSKNLAGNLLFDPSRLLFSKAEEANPEEGVNCDFNSSYNNTFQPFQLPIDLEITKVPDTKNQLLSKLLDMKTSESAYDVSNNNKSNNKDNIIELLIPKQLSSIGIGNNPGQTCSSKNYPCGHCTEEFDSLSSLLKHTARNHVPKNGIGDTFHIEIETRD